MLCSVSYQPHEPREVYTCLCVNAPVRLVTYPDVSRCATCHASPLRYQQNRARKSLAIDVLDFEDQSFLEEDDEPTFQIQADSNDLSVPLSESSRDETKYEPSRVVV